MTYKEQLETTEWTKKREQILFRDNYQCQSCGKHGVCGLNVFITIDNIRKLNDYIEEEDVLELLNSQLHENICLKENKENFEIWEDDEIYPPTNKEGLIFYPIITANTTQSPPHYISFLKINDIKDIFEYDFKEKDMCVDILECKQPKKIISPFLFQICNVAGNDVYQLITKSKSIIIRKNPAALPILNIHHKSYIIDHLAWEYDDSNLITLCENCHKELHKNHEIPLYDENHNLISHLETCSKCGGIGYIYKYKHYHNGICFDCGGTGVIIT